MRPARRLVRAVPLKTPAVLRKRSSALLHKRKNKGSEDPEVSPPTEDNRGPTAGLSAPGTQEEKAPPPTPQLPNPEEARATARKLGLRLILNS